jgi:hypothetical protein
VKTIGALCLSLAIASPANAVCLFGIGTTCPIPADRAAGILKPRVSGKLLGAFRFEHTILFDTLRLGRSEPKPGDNVRRMARARRALGYMDGNYDCGNVEAVWDSELPFDKSKQIFCEFAHLLKRRNLASLQLYIGHVQPNEGKQDVFLRFAMTEDGQTKLERFLLGRDDLSVTVATRTVNFLRVVRREGAASATVVEFQYELVPNVWAHVEKGLATDTLPAERKVGKATLRKSSDQWDISELPTF